MDDWKLLREYAESGSEAAFQGLVSRHVNMVYSAALRQLRDSHLAQDVTQAVFILLARKATSLRSSVMLSGWLYRTTLHLASRAMRDRIRQQHREEEASMMIADEPAEELWEKLAPHLDAAIGTLGEIDRDAVVLRFLQQRSFREVAGTLGVSEDAAKKRVTRALEKLRATLTARGIAVTGAILATTMGAKAVSTAPAGVVAAAMSAVGTGAASATAMTLAEMIARQWFLTRLKWAAGIAGGAALVVLVATQTDIFKASTILSQNEVAEAASTSAVTSAASEGIVGEAATPTSPTNPRTMRLRVLAAKDNSPLREAKANIVFYGAKFIREEAAADTNGVMEITRPNRKFSGMVFWVAGAGYVPKCVSWKQEEELSLPSEYIIKLYRGVRTGGTVVNEDGALVVGAKLRFDGEGMKWNARDYVSYQHPPAVPTSDERGEWIADFLEDKPRIRGFVEHPEYAETEFWISQSSGVAENTTIIIKRGALVSGVVQGDDGAAVTNAQVVVDWQYSARTEVKMESGADGWFNFPHVTPGGFRLEATAEGYHSLEKWFELSTTGTNLTLRMTPKKIAGNSLLRGRVVDETGDPIAGIHVSPSYGQPALDGVGWSATTDSEGRFSWKQAPDGAVRLSFSSWDFQHLDGVEFTSDNVEQVVVMKPVKTLEVKCTVMDKKTGLAIPIFKVMHGTRRDLPGLKAVDGLDFMGEGREGQFTFRRRCEPIRTEPDRAEPILHVEADGYAQKTVSLAKAVDTDLELKIELEKADDIEGIVLSPQGSPASDAQVALLGAGMAVDMQQPARFLLVGNDARTHSTTTKKDGSFRLAARKEGERLVVVHDNGWVIIVLQEPTVGSVTLQPWGSIEGVLWRGQAPAPNEKVTLRSDYAEAETIPFNFTFKTDATGRFRFDKVPPGRAHISRYLLTPFSKDGTGLGANTQEKSIDVKAGESLHLTLGGSGVCVTGRFVLQSSRKDVVLELYPQNLRPAHVKPDPTKLPTGYGFFCQPDGSFVIDDVLPGDYVLETRVNAVRDRHNPESAFSSFTVGERNVEVVIPDNQSEIFDLGEIVVPVKNDPLPQGVR